MKNFRNELIIAAPFILIVLVATLASSGCTAINLQVRTPLNDGKDSVAIYQVQGVVPCWDDKDVELAKAIADGKLVVPTNAPATTPAPETVQTDTTVSPSPDDEINL